MDNTDSEPEPFWSEGWAKEDLPDGKYKITVPLSNVNRVASTGQLLVKTGWAFEIGDIIEVGDIEALITKREAAWDFPHHTWVLTIECERDDELWEILTYHVDIDKKSEVPKYKGGA